MTKIYCDWGGYAVINEKGELYRVFDTKKQARELSNYLCIKYGVIYRVAPVEINEVDGLDFSEVDVCP